MVQRQPWPRSMAWPKTLSSSEPSCFLLHVQKRACKMAASSTFAEQAASAGLSYSMHLPNT